MMKNILYKLLISFIVALPSVFLPSYAKTFVSVSPAMTEIMYAIGAQDQLSAVSDVCSYPIEAKTKEKIGSGYLLNEEKIIKIKPDYILALDSSSALLNKFKQFGIEPVCFEYPDTESILNNFEKLGKLTGKEKEAQKLKKSIKEKIISANKKGNKKVLYLIQSAPIITIGKRSFLTDVIEKSGNYSATKDLDMAYPQVSEEYLIKRAPDIIVILPYADDKRLKELFPNTKIVRLTDEESEIFNRPGPRIYKAVEFFSRL